MRFCGLSTTDLIVDTKLHICTNKDKCACHAANSDQEFLSFNTLNKALSQALIELGNDYPAAVTLVAADDDSWMHLTPEELEQEMRTRITNTSSFTKGSDDTPLDTKTPPADAIGAKLGTVDDMLSGVKIFLGRNSGLEGPDDGSESENVSENESDTGSDDEGVDSDSPPNSINKSFGALDINFDKLLKIVESDTSKEIATSRDVPHFSSEGIGSGHIPSNHFEMNDRVHSSDDIIDSDDESQSFGSEEGFDDAYAQAMEEQLRNTTVSETFERDADGAVDIDKNLMKNMFESHASQDGTYGPASQLFSQLGLSFPSLPKDN